MNATSEEDINLNFPSPRDGTGSSQNNSDSSESRATTAFQAITDSSRDRTESSSTAYERKTEPGKQASDVHVTTLPPLAEHTASSSLRKTRWQSLYLIIKRLLPCVLTIFLASIFVVNKRIAFLAGTAEYSFLIIVIYTLFFHSAQHTVGKHIQVTAIGITGAIVGIGWSALAYYLACLANWRAGISEDSNSMGARAACATFLAAIAFVAADLKSRFPRLTTGCLLSVFTTIWLLAVTVRSQQITAAPFLGMLYAVVFAAGISLLVSLLVFPASSSKLLAQQVIDTLGITSELLLTTLHLFQADARSVYTIKEYRSLCEQVLHLRQELGSAVAKLRPAYEDARYELTYALFPLEQYEAFINLSLKLQTILVSRMGLKVNGHACSSEFAAAAIPEFELTQEDHDKPAYLRTLVDELGRMNLTALNTIRCAVARSSFLPDSAENVSNDTEGGQTGGIHGLKDVFREKELHKLRERLDDIVETFRSGIVGALDMAVQQHGSAEDGSQRLFRSNAFRDCFFFTSLVELTSDIQDGLMLASELPHPSSRSRRIWVPALATLFETSRSSSTFSAHTEEDEAAQQEWDKEKEKKKQRALLSLEAESAAQLPFIQLSRPRHRKQWLSLRYWRTFAVSRKAGIGRWWTSPKVYRWRLRTDESIQSFQNSRHLKHAFKCAFGLSLLTLPGHLPAEYKGYQWFEDVRGPWIAISFLYCLQTSTAATIRDAIFRTLGTFSGAIYGLVGQKIAGRNPYALVAVMTFQAFFSNYLILFKPRFQGVGIVGQLTIPAILFVPYLNLEYDSVVELAFIRAQDIEIGIVSALLLNTFLWPYHARVQLVTACAKATDRIIKLYLSMSRQVLQRNYTMTAETKKQYELLEDETRMVLTRAANLCDLVHIETSLLPKPVKKYRKLIADLNELVNLWSGLRAIRQNIPRKLTVLDVLPQRTELITSILIILHAISHSLHTHSPVPQFLPHPHAALEHLILAIEEHVETVATSPLGSGPGTSQQLPSIQSTLVSSSFGSSNKVPFPSFSPPSPMRSSSGKLGFSFAFALAENEAISEAVDTLSDIIETCKDLYGVASFIQQDEVDNMGDNVASYLHTPVRTPTRSARQSFSDAQRSPASPTRSIRLSMSPHKDMRVGR